MQAQRFELDLQNPHKNARLVISVLGKQRQVDFWSSLASRSTLIVKFQANEKPCPKEVDRILRMTPEVAHGPPHTPFMCVHVDLNTCILMNTHMNTHTQMHTRIENTYPFHPALADISEVEPPESCKYVQSYGSNSVVIGVT